MGLFSSIIQDYLVMGNQQKDSLFIHFDIYVFANCSLFRYILVSSSHSLAVHILLSAIMYTFLRHLYSTTYALRY